MAPVILFAARWWKAGVGAAVAFPIAFGLGHCSGHRDGVKAEKTAELKRLERAQKAVAKREKKADAITEKVSDQLTQERVRIEYRTRYLTQEIVRYVPQAADDRCVLNAGFVMLHDAAASGGEAVLPEASGGSVEAPSGVAPSEAAGVIVANYGAAHAWRAEALSWREWYQRQSAEWGRR